MSDQVLRHLTPGSTASRIDHRLLLLSLMPKVRLGAELKLIAQAAPDTIERAGVKQLTVQVKVREMKKVSGWF